MKQLCVLILLTLWSCQKKNQNISSQLPLLYANPISKSVKLGNEDYTHHTLTQDVLQPILTSEGDTVVTGELLPLRGKQVSIKSKKLAIEKFTIDTLGFTPFQKPKLTKYEVIPVAKQKTNKTLLINAQGDTLPSGMPIPLRGTKQVLQQPVLEKADKPKKSTQAPWGLQCLTTVQGMLSSEVYDLVETPQQNLWLATSEGLTHYDGTFFKHYTTKEGLSDQEIFFVHQDWQQNVWFGGSNGFYRYDGDSLMVFKLEDVMMNAVDLTNIVEDQKGNLWWNSDNGVSKYDGQYLTQYTTQEGLDDNRVIELYKDHQGSIWVGTAQGLNCIKDGKVIQYHSGQLSNLGICTIYEDQHNHLWLGTIHQGVFKFDGQNFIHYLTGQDLPDNFVSEITEDSQGNLWMSTHEQGLIKFDGQSFTFYAQQTGLQSKMISNILIDNKDQLWMSTMFNGLVKVQLNSFEYPLSHLRKEINSFNAFGVDHQNNVWIVAANQELLRFDGKFWTRYAHPFLSNDIITLSLPKKQKGDIWLGTVFKGLIRYHQNQLYHYELDAEVYTLLEDRQGNIWIGTSGKGLFKFDGQAFTQYTQKEGLISNHINTLLEDHQGNIWIGSTEGISKLVEHQMINYSLQEGLSSKNILVLYEDKQRDLWLGTKDYGLINFDGLRFSYYTEREGLPSNRIESLQGDKQGRLWVGTSKGLMGLFPQKYNATKGPNITKRIPYQFANMGKQMSFVENGVCLNHQQYLWWGASGRLVRLDLDRFKLSIETPKVILKEVLINEQPIDFRKLRDSLRSMIYFDSLPTFTNLPEGLSVSSHHNHFTFRFATAAVNQASSVYYSHRIKELKQQWSKPSQVAEVDYRNLPSGTFTFEVRAVNQYQQWGEPFTYTFTICPPWWQAGWFKAMLVILGTTLLTLYHTWRLLLAKKRQIILENLVTEKTKKIQEQSDIILEAKEKEKEILEQVAKNKERRFLTAVQFFDEKYRELQQVEDKLNQAVKRNNHIQLQKTMNSFKTLLRTIRDLDVLSENIEAKYSKILAEITHQFPNLSPNEAKNCLLIKLNCSPKEAAQLLNVSVNAIHMARKRLRKKFNLSEGDSLPEFLQRSLP